MLKKAIIYYHNAKWLHLIISLFGILLGIYMYYHAYSHISNNLDGSILILMLSGSLFLIAGILDLTSLTKRFLTFSFISAISVLTASVLYFNHY